MRRLFFAACCVLFSFSAFANEPSQETLEHAKALYEKGKLSFELRRFEEAIELFEQAYEEVQFPEFLLNIAQCYKQLHRCEDAIFLYKQYLNQGEDVDREGTQALIDACEEELAATAASQPTSTPTSVPGASQPAALPIPRLWYDLRLVLGSGSVGSQETGGKNTLGAGLAGVGGLRFHIFSEFDALLLASLEAHSTGVTSNADSVLESSLDLRSSLSAYGAFRLTSPRALLAGAGLVLGVEGASPISARVSLGSIFASGSSGRLLVLLNYERGGAGRGLNQILGCSADTACLYQQMQLAIGWRPEAKHAP